MYATINIKKIYINNNNICKHNKLNTYKNTIKINIQEKLNKQYKTNKPNYLIIISQFVPLYHPLICVYQYN